MGSLKQFLLLGLTVVICTTGQETKPTDLVFIVDRSADNGRNNDWQIRKGLIDIVHEMVVNVNDADKKGIRLAMVSFNKKAHVEFDFFDLGLSLSRMLFENGLHTKFWNMPYTSVDEGSDLPGALLLASELFEQSNPENNQHAIVIASRDATENLDRLDEGIEKIHAYFRTVYAIGFGLGWSDQEILKVVKDESDMAYRLVYGKADNIQPAPTSIELQLLLLSSWQDVWEKVAVTMTHPRVSTLCWMTTTSDCSVSCGIGTYYSQGTCSVYVDGLIVSYEASYTSQCCQAPCSRDDSSFRQCKWLSMTQDNKV